METKLIIVGIVTSIFALFLSVAVDEIIVVNFDLNELDQINLKNSYFETEGVLLNNYRDTVIYPDDKLTFKISLRNNHENTIQYNATLNVLKSGEPIMDTIYFETRELAPNSWTFYQKDFFVGDEGNKELKVNFIGKTVSTGEINIEDDYTKILEVQSLSDKIQSDQTYVLLLGVIASSIIGGGTLTTLYFNQKTSNKEIDKLDEQNEFSKQQIELLRQQNNDLKKQHEIQNRPWVTISNLQPDWMRVNGQLMPYDKNHQASLNSLWEELHFKLYFKNVGLKPAINFKIITEYDSTPIPLDLIKNSNNEIQTLTLLPSESIPFRFKIPTSQIDNTKKLYFGIKIEYGLDFITSKKQSQYYVYEFGKSSWNLITSEIDDVE